MWISRLMTVVFLLNVMSPAYAQVSSSRRLLEEVPPSVTEARKNEQVARGVVDAVELSRQQYLEAVSLDLEAATNDFLNASTFAEMRAAYQKLDKLREEGSQKLRTYQFQIMTAENEALQASGNVTFEYYQQHPEVAPDAVSQTVGYDARFGSDPKDWPLLSAEYSKHFAGYQCPAASVFLEKLKNDKFESEDELLDYIDPLGFNCGDFLAIAYASEMLYYMQGEFTRTDSIPQEQREEKTAFLSRARYRSVASLKRLNNLNFSDETLYMARGTLRLLLTRLEQIAFANKLQLWEKKLYLLKPTKKLWQTQHPQPTQAMKAEGARYVGPSYQEFVKTHTYVVEELSPKLETARSQGNVNVQEITYADYQKKSVGKGILSDEDLAALREGIPGDLGGEFYNELKDLKSKSSGAGSAEFALLQLVVQYAAQFAVLTGNERLLKDILALFEDSAGSDMKTTYSEVLAAFFNSIYETLRGFDVSEHYTSAVMFLLDAAKDSHATDTRVLALATLGHLTEKTDSLDIDRLKADFSVTEEGEIVNKYWLSYHDRFVLAQFVADLYEPLQNTSLYGMKDYGLNAEEMVSLSDSLAGIYMQFLPIEAPTVTLGHCGHVDKIDTENRTIVTVSDLQNTKNGQIRDGDCEFYYTHGGVFVFGGRGGTVEMTALNYRNSRKYSEEITNKGMELFGESLMWVFGGALISGAFRGLRLLAGAVKSLPRAIRSGKLVYNATTGTRVHRLAAATKRAKASVKVGTKYMSNGNFNAHLAQNGMAYNVTPVLAGKPGLVKTTTALNGAATRIPSPSTRVTVTAADAASGLAYQGNFGVSPYIGRWALPVQRAQFLRFAQQQGLRNVWNVADRSMFQNSVMWRNAFNTLWDPTKAQLSYYPGAILTEHPWVQAGLTAYGRTLRFFAWWKAGDIFTGILYRDSFNQWMTDQQEKAIEAEAAKYGESLSAEAIAEVEAQNSGEPEFRPGDVSIGGTPKESFGWMDVLTFPSYLWQRIAPAEMDMTDGSLVLPPVMFARTSLADSNILSNPFITDATKQQVAINAHRMNYSRAQIAKSNHLSFTATENDINTLAQARESLQQNIAVFKADFPDVDWDAEERDLMGMLNEYEQALRATETTVNLRERTQQKTAVIQQYGEKLDSKYTQLESKYIQLCDKRFNTTVEDQITSLELSRYNDLISLKEVGLDLSHPEIYERLDGIYQGAISELKNLQNPSVPSPVKVDKFNRCIQKIVSEREKILGEANNLLWSEQEREKLYPDETVQWASQAY